MQVFVVLKTQRTPDGVITDVAQVFEHIHDAMPYTKALREDGVFAQIIRKQVVPSPEPGIRVKIGEPRSAFAPDLDRDRALAQRQADRSAGREYACHGPSWYDNSCTHQPKLGLS